MSFMMRIDAAAPSPLDLLARDFFTTRSGHPSLEFCKRSVGVAESDAAVAARLGVAISTVRGWRDVGRRGMSCH